MHNEKHISTFRILHYPPKLLKQKSLDDEERIFPVGVSSDTLVTQVAKNPDKDYVISTPVHTDGSILTLLCTFDNYGLQVRVARTKIPAGISTVRQTLVR